MTLVACVIPRIETYPILLGDILITSENDQSASITTHSNVELDLLLPKDHDLKPTELCQKIYIINEYLCVAVAGSAFEIKQFLQDFRIYAKYSSPSKEFINNYVIDPERKALMSKSIAMILFYEKIDNSPGNFGINFLFGDKIQPPERIETEVFGTVFSAGSGKMTFDNKILEATNAGHEDLRFNAIMNCINLIASCVGAEKMLPTHTLKNYWGAGYELIFFEQSFRYLEDVAYIICRGAYNDEGDIQFPKPDFVLFQRYYKGRLLAYAINIFAGFVDEVGESMRYRSKHGEFSVDVWEIPSIDNIEPSVFSDDLEHSFKSSTIGICYAIWTEKSTCTFSDVAINSYRTSVTFSEGSLEILIGTNIVRGKREYAKEIFKNL